MYISVEDFYRQTQALPRLTQKEEADCARRMAQGDTTARERLVQQYLPFAAALIRRSPSRVQTLHTVYSAVVTVGKCVDTFDFANNREPFIRYLSRAMRQCLTRCLAES